MLAAARVTLKLHRFEVGVAALVAVAAAVLGLIIALRLDALGVTQECLRQVRASPDGSGVDAGCLSLVREGSGILGESYLDGDGTIPLSVMGALPFLVGLLGGVPIVAREAEARTRQTAWSLNPSRSRWLGRQVAPVALVLTVATALAALAAMAVGDQWVRWGNGGYADLIGLQGPLLVIRAFGAFGIGLAVGTLLGRTLPAFVFGLALALVLLFALGQARERWLAGLPASPLGAFSGETGEWNGTPGEVATSWGWLAPDGDLISRDEARKLASDAGVPPGSPGDVQDTPASQWLSEHGYVSVPLGVTDEAALGWAPFDGVAFGLVGLISVGSALLLVNRQRPI